jgi:hypothetical protein
MTRTATWRPQQDERRVDLRLSPQEHARLQDSARLALRSTSGQARHLLLKALADEQRDAKRGTS